MMIAEANVMIFDEPTNHLDLEAITALNNAMIDFPAQYCLLHRITS